MWFICGNLLKKTYDKENLKLNCQQVVPSTQFPSESVKEIPNCISFSKSTLHLNVFAKGGERGKSSDGEIVGSKE
jgi:hypothetical protein